MGGTYGLSTRISKTLPPEDILQQIATAGFKHLELSSDPDHLAGWVRGPEKLGLLLETAGLQVFSVHTPISGWNNNHPDESVRRQSIEAAASCFQPSLDIGAGVVITHPTYSKAPLTAEAYEGNVTRARTSLAELADRAGALRLRLAIENLPARGTCRPGATVEQVLELIDGLGAHVGVCVDAGHANANGQSAAEEVRLAGERLFAVHIQDNDGQGEDTHHLPGDGTTDWEAFIKALDEIGFSSPRNFEIPATQGTEDQILSKLSGLAHEWSKL